MNTKYYISKWENGNMGNQSFVECPSARPIALQGFEEFNFFIHRKLLPNGEWATKNWRISETTTGMSCGGNDATSRQECVELTITILNRVGKDKLSECIAKAPKVPVRNA